MTTWEPNITVRALQPVVAALQKLGYDCNPLLKASKISPSILDNPEGRIPHKAMMQLWKLAVEMTEDDCLGIHLAETAPIKSFEVHSYALLSSPTLREAYHRACRYQSLIHEATSLVLENQSTEAILQHMLPGGRSVPRHPAEFLVTLWLRFGRLVTGDNWVPSLVCFAHPQPQDISTHERVFSTSIQFQAGRTAMHIPQKILDTPNPSADLGLLNILDRYAEILVKQSPSLNTVSDRVKKALTVELKGGNPQAEVIAKALSMSVRSLHRALKQEGTSFQELLDLLRQEQAYQLLANPRTSIAEVAFLLGFAEVSSFHKACQRWTGKTPGEIRELGK